MDKKQAKALRALFLKYLTVDSNFNQALFDSTKGWACFTDISLSMVMSKFDKSIAELEGK